MQIWVHGTCAAIAHVPALESDTRAGVQPFQTSIMSMFNYLQVSVAQGPSRKEGQHVPLVYSCYHINTLSQSGTDEGNPLKTFCLRQQCQGTSPRLSKGDTRIRTPGDLPWRV